MGDTMHQTRFENVSKHSNDPLLARGNTLQSDKDRLKLDELMARCTTLQNRVLDLEKTKTTQHNENASLKIRVKKIEKKNRSRNYRAEVLYKIGLTSRVESSDKKKVWVRMHPNRGGLMLLIQMKQLPCTKPKEKGVVIQELGESTTTISSQQSQDKGKGILIEPVKPIKKKNQIRFDEETTLHLQAEFDEEERLVREKAKKEKEANIALIDMGDI
ncbi:hypothetical protein Tco_1493659 [Tanacetum coccineum]